jgi:hypothetical protein
MRLHPPDDPLGDTKRRDRAGVPDGSWHSKAVKCDVGTT